MKKINYPIYKQPDPSSKIFISNESKRRIRKLFER